MGPSIFGRSIAGVWAVIAFVSGVRCLMNPETAAKKDKIERLRERGTLRTYAVWQGILDFFGGAVVLAAVLAAKDDKTALLLFVAAFLVGFAWKHILDKHTLQNQIGQH